MNAMGDKEISDPESIAVMFFYVFSCKFLMPPSSRFFELREV